MLTNFLTPNQSARGSVNGNFLPPIAVVAMLFGTSLIFAFASAHASRAQTAEALSGVEKVYVEPFGQETDEVKLRTRTVEQLKHKGRLEVVNSPGEADALIKGSGSIWVIGYVSNSARSPGAGREAVFRGFLSVEVIGKNGEPLWSYLVTPSRFAAGDITNAAFVELLQWMLTSGQKECSALEYAPLPREVADQELQVVNKGK
jgi:hypothetical protein